MPQQELERAKHAAISSVLMNLESRAVVAEDIGRQILTYGHRCTLSLSMSPPSLQWIDDLHTACGPLHCVHRPLQSVIGP